MFKLVFFLNEASMEKMFLSQEVAIIRLSFDQKNLIIEATQMSILKIRGGVFFLPGTVSAHTLDPSGPFWTRFGVFRR